MKLTGITEFTLFQIIVLNKVIEGFGPSFDTVLNEKEQIHIKSIRERIANLIPKVRSDSYGVSVIEKQIKKCVCVTDPVTSKLTNSPVGIVELSFDQAHTIKKILMLINYISYKRVGLNHMEYEALMSSKETISNLIYDIMDGSGDFL